jgi:hypothetical protein
MDYQLQRFHRPFVLMLMQMLIRVRRRRSNRIGKLRIGGTSLTSISGEFNDCMGTDVDVI